MKKSLTLFLFLIVKSLLIAQSYTAKIPSVGQWENNELLTFISSDGQSKIEMMTTAKKVKKNDHRIKHLKIDGIPYRLIHSAGAINLMDAAGNILFKTNPDGTQVFSAKNEKFTRTKVDGQLQYRDIDNKVVFGGILKKGRLFVKYYGDDQEHLLLMVLGIEEILQQEHQRQMNGQLIPLMVTSLMND